MAVAYNSSKIVTDGLVFALDAANIQSYPRSGTTWTETTRTGITGTLVNSPTYVSANGGYFSFDGINDYCSLSSPPNIAGAAATFCVWNYGILAQNSSIIWIGAPLGNRMFQVHLPWSGNVIYFDAGNVNSASESYDRISKAVANAEYQGWHHWTFIKNSTAGTMSIYRNGTLWHSGSGLSMPVGQPGYGYIGGLSNIYFHNGYISNLQFYNRALSQTEIQQNFNATRARFGV